MNRVSVQCRGLQLSYGRTEVLRDVSLDIEPGEFFALLGPSGSGKSTLLRVVAGFARQQHGQVLVDGRDVGALPPWRRRIGMVFQNYALWPHLTVRDNVAFGLVEARVARPEIDRRVGAALETVGLSGYGDRRPNQLSGGQQQRVALARTIVVEPQVLLLDEPLSNLDKTLRVQMRRELLAMQRRLGLTTVFVTHDQEEAMTTADRMAVLDGGVVQQVGTPMALYDRPASAFVAGFIGTTNLLPARLRERRADGWLLDVEGLGELRLPAPADDLPATAAGDRLTVSLRPQALRAVPAGGTRDAGFAWRDGTVEDGEFLGESVRHRVRVGSLSLVVDRAHRPGLAPLAAGSAVGLGVEPAQVRVFAG